MDPLYRPAASWSGPVAGPTDDGSPSTRVKELFLAAIAVEAHARGALLEEACGADRGLHRRVEALLAAHERADRLFASPGRDEVAGPTEGVRRRPRRRASGVEPSRR